MDTLEIVFATCLAFGVIYALVTLLIGDIIGHFLASIELPLFQPLALIAAITGFGGCGLLLLLMTSMGPWPIIILSAVFGIFLCILFYFLWIKPMAKAERTTTFSYQDLEGSIGEVYTTVPASGYGEVVIIRSSGRANYIAASFDQVEIPKGAKIVVVKVINRILHVSLLPF